MLNYLDRFFHYEINVFIDRNAKFGDIKKVSNLLWLYCRFTLPPFLTLKNFEGLDLGMMDKVRTYINF